MTAAIIAGIFAVCAIAFYAGGHESKQKKPKNGEIYTIGGKILYRQKGGIDFKL